MKHRRKASFFLASFPHAGRARDDDFGIGSRSFAVGEYAIVYCVEGEDGCAGGGDHVPFREHARKLTKTPWEISRRNLLDRMPSIAVA